uniref:Uncharacterized protein n=1 Tax=Psilocybe cubensis TaxID=181762 RepID=A0A8H7XT22_PSICU
MTELSIGNPKIGHSQELGSRVGILKRNSISYNGVYQPLAWGTIRQTSQFVLAIGWDNVQAHLNAIHIPPVKPLAELNLSDISDLVVSHVILHRRSNSSVM